MFSYTELRGQSSLDKHGAIELNTTYVTARKPLWLVCLKVVVMAGMVSLGFAILVPLLMQALPPWSAALVSLGILLIYIGVSFFCRPQCNSDNLGWFGGMANDPFQYSDNINRFLFQLHMLLGPGRFAAETLLDVCTLAGLAKGPEVIAEPEPAVALVEPSAYSHSSGGAASPPQVPKGLRPDRFDSSGGNAVWR